MNHQCFHEQWTLAETISAVCCCIEQPCCQDQCIEFWVQSASFGRIDRGISLGGRMLNFKGCQARAQAPLLDCRWMLGVAGLPALMQLCGLFFLPESPRSDICATPHLCMLVHGHRPICSIGLSQYPACSLQCCCMELHQIQACSLHYLAEGPLSALADFASQAWVQIHCWSPQVACSQGTQRGSDACTACPAWSAVQHR